MGIQLRIICQWIFLSVECDKRAQDDDDVRIVQSTVQYQKIKNHYYSIPVHALKETIIHLSKMLLSLEFST